MHRAVHKHTAAGVFFRMSCKEPKIFFSKNQSSAPCLFREGINKEEGDGHWSSHFIYFTLISYLKKIKISLKHPFQSLITHTLTFVVKCSCKCHNITNWLEIQGGCKVGVAFKPADGFVRCLVSPMNKNHYKYALTHQYASITIRKLGFDVLWLILVVWQSNLTLNWHLDVPKLANKIIRAIKLRRYIKVRLFLNNVYLYHKIFLKFYKNIEKELSLTDFLSAIVTVPFY